MSQEPLAQPIQQDEANASLEAQPATDASKTVAVTTEQAEPQQPEPPKTAVKKAAAKPKGAKKTVAGQAEPKAVVAEEKPVRKGATKAVGRVSTDSKVEAAKVEKVSKDKKPLQKKPKLVRDSFTIPENDYELFARLKQRALTAGVEVKKSELLRAGLAMLATLDDAEFIKAVGLVDRIKTGRPKK